MTVSELGYVAADDDQDGNIAQRADRLCTDTPGRAVLFTGRSEDLRLLLNSMIGAFGAGRYPHIVGGDDLTRFALTNELPAALSGLQLDYLAQASSLAWGPDCAAAEIGSIFFAYYADLSDQECVTARDGTAALAFDTINVVSRAILDVREPSRPGDPGTPLTPPDVLRGISTINGSSSLNGAVTGRIDFGPSGRRAVPVDKAVLVLRVTTDNDVPRHRLLCGTLDSSELASDQAQAHDLLHPCVGLSSGTWPGTRSRGARCSPGSARSGPPPCRSAGRSREHHRPPTHWLLPVQPLDGP